VGDSVTRGDTDGGRPWLALAPALLLFAVSVILFARLQNVWIDETTQLSGATLTPGPLIAWLTGDLKIPFGVPADRMPPVSYFIDMIGWRIWGDNELAFRLYHAAITAGGLVLLIVAAARRFGTRVALIAGLILALSPKLIEMAVEIRAYPIFFALSCAQAAMVVRGDVAGRTGRLALFLLLGLLSGYTHFFGVVASSAYVVAVFLDARDVRSAVRVVIGYALLLAAWTGLAPFIFGAASLSVASQAAETGAGSLASFFAQLLSGGARGGRAASAGGAQGRRSAA
jgi:4-amino-4-deoxy-L-arabinose transferase-like glycosyltransferase